MKEVIIKFLLILAALGTTGYLLMLGWYNNLSLDDYSLVVDIEHGNALDLAINQYLTWQGRFSAFFVSAFIFKIWGRAASLISWTIIHLTLGYLVIDLWHKKLNIHMPALQRIAISILISNIAILGVFELSTFYWLCCAGYFLVIYVTIFLMYIVFAADWKPWVKWISCVIPAIYISGSSENYTPLVLMFLGIIWLIRMVKETKQASFAVAFRANGLLFMNCAILLIGFFVMILAPGNEVRMQGMGIREFGFMKNFTLIPFLEKTIIANGIFALRLLSRGLYYVGTLPIFIWIGSWINRSRNLNITSKDVLVASMCLIMFLFIAVTACVYGIGYYPPLRAMSFVSYAMIFYCGYIGIHIGALLHKEGLTINTIMLKFALCLWTVYAGYYTYKEYPSVQEYHALVENRAKVITDQINLGKDEPLYVEAFTVPHWESSYCRIRTFVNKCIGTSSIVDETYFPYMISNITQDDPKSFINSSLQQYYGANFDILSK